jgi:TonB family protein
MPNLNAKAGTESLTARDLSRRTNEHLAEVVSAHPDRFRGTVVLDSVLRKDGSLSIMGIVEGLGFGLDAAAQSALQEWRFNPGMRDGRPVDTRLYLEINFNSR